MSGIRITRRGLFAACLARSAAGAAVKIESVQAYPIPLLPTSRFGTANFKSDYDPARWRWFGPFSQLAGSIMVEVHTDQGLTGYGLGGGGGAGAYIVNHHLRDLLVGANALNTELLWDQMFASTSFYGRRGLAIMAISGIDLALWDIAGKHAGKPVYQLLGGATKDKVPAYATGNDVERGLKLGFTAFKLPVPEGVAQGPEGMRRTVRRLKEARDAIGPDKLLMIDCLARWDVPYTLEMADRLEPVKLHFIEEPLYPHDIAGYERLCEEVRSTRIASGEHEYTRFGFQELIRHKAADVLQPDITWSGGLSELRRIAALASAASLPIIPHRGGSLYGLPLVLSAPNCHLAESFGTGEPGNELMEAMTAPFKDGYYYPPEKPGFGVELGEAVLRKYRVR